MSASSKKKLRQEQEAVKLTEKQLTAKKEAKKLNLYTTAFVAVLVLLLAVAIGVGVTQTIANSGTRERSTVALTVGDHEISNAELNYYYIDAINNFYSQYGQYAMMFGLDPTLPLNEQIVDESTGLTWADDFLSSAKSTAAATYAMKDAADAAGFVLTEEQITAIDQDLSSLDLYAAMYGYPDGESYLKAVYGIGATIEGYSEYTKMRTLADSYYQHYGNSLEFSDEELRAAEAENFDNYFSYSYHVYSLTASNYRTGGTTDEEGNVTYSEEETAAALAAAKADADALMAAEITSVEDFDKAIAALEINAESPAVTSNAYADTLYANISTAYSSWVTDASRKEGDMQVFENTTVTTAEDGTETTVTNGYYVVYFLNSTDNTFPLKNVRHILVAFSHDDTVEEGHDHSGTAYTNAEIDAAKAAAEDLLAQWKAGDATEESFALLANEHSDDGDGTTGGLYENVYPGQMVVNFNNWCYDESRKSGDTGIVESTYGYHVMYFVGDAEINYRDFQISNELRSEAVNTWYTEAIEAMTQVDGDTRYIKMDIVLNAA